MPMFRRSELKQPSAVELFQASTNLCTSGPTDKYAQSTAGPSFCETGFGQKLQLFMFFHWASQSSSLDSTPIISVQNSSKDAWDANRSYMK